MENKGIQVNIAQHLHVKQHVASEINIALYYT